MSSSSRNQRKRRRQRRVLNRRWSIGLTVSVALVVIGIAGVLLADGGVFPGRTTYFFFAAGAIGAVTAMIQTLVRMKSGDDIDEAKL
jgi:hypothetical protein